jgi:cytochrome c556
MLLALGSSVAVAQGADIIKQRQDLMGGLGDAMKAPSAMMKGEAAFDLAKVQGSLATLQANSGKLKSLWPETSKTGGNTRALPAIWTDMKTFSAHFDGLATGAKAAADAIKDEASFKSQWPKVASTCGACHKDFRAAKK